MSDLFRTPINAGRVRKDTFWHKYDTGIILIEDKGKRIREQYQFYSIKNAIRHFCMKHPARKFNSQGESTLEEPLI